MMKPEFFKPFSAEHARAGAPIGCPNGWRPEVLKYAEGGLFGTITNTRLQEFPVAWSQTGEANCGVTSKDWDLVMLPLGMISGKPVFVGDDYLGPVGQPLRAGPSQRRFTLCAWPSPTGGYPQSRMTASELFEIYTKTWGENDICLPNIANAALRHAIDAGQVVPVSDAKPGLRPHDPYTGKLRDPRDIKTDPMGVLVRHVDEPLNAAGASDSSITIDRIGTFHSNKFSVDRLRMLLIQNFGDEFPISIVGI